MVNIQNINDYGLEDPGFALLREVAQKYCPEELQAERRAVIPDEALDLSSLSSLFQPFGLYLSEAPSAESLTTPLPHREGQGEGLLPSVPSAKRSSASCTTRRPTR